jgi:hypothetical protein
MEEILSIPTPEEIQRQIRAAFDSVDLINGIIDGTKMVDAPLEKKKNTVSRNVEHLEIMMAKTWFVEGCTPIQITEINTCIAAGNAYVG